MVPCPQRKVELRSLNPLLKQGFAPLCPCHNCYLKLFTRGKKLAVYPVSVVTSVSEGKQEADCKCLNWSPPMSWGFPGGSVGKESICSAGDLLQHRRPSFDPWVKKIPWRRKWQPTSVFLSGKSHGQRSWRATVYGAARVGHD